MSNFYAVKKGHTTGIFNTWDECKSATSGFPNAEFKKFVSIEEANAYLADKDLWIFGLKKLQKIMLMDI